MASFHEVCMNVLKKVTPSPEEKAKALAIAERMIRRLQEEAEKLNAKITPMLVGSLAKDTWIRGNQDIDIFMVFPQSYSFNEIGELGLKLARRATGGLGEEQYAEHPYLRANIEGFTVEFVPCFEIEDPSQMRSSVDRTPLHTRYVKERLNETLKGEIRLLKAFMKGIGAYGAEIRVGGFSGYLCELLIIHYGSFGSLLNESLKWKPGHVIDPAKHYEDHEKPRKIFQSPLIVVDPIDPKRNVAAALTLQKFNEFRAAAKAFLEEPKEAFFFPPKVPSYPPEKLSSALRERGTSMLLIVFPTPRLPPDILWGQLSRSIQAVEKVLEQHDFKVLNRDVWSGEDETAFIIELESKRLPRLKKQLGPPPATPHQSRFLKKHLTSHSTISGPRVEKDRWVVEVGRKYDDAEALLKDVLRKPDIGLGKHIAEKTAEKLTIYSDDEILRFYSKNPSFQEHFTLTLLGRPKWLLPS
ncbi:MAG: CCA tRNA nucleotidyltransferase [Candidatus Freyarchaeota archaeon]|nr:CCA tRNA nucleotidyltransferase [Candidatus Freyrarchaeum guaymaensis]